MSVDAFAKKIEFAVPLQPGIVSAILLVVLELIFVQLVQELSVRVVGRLVARRIQNGNRVKLWQPRIPFVSQGLGGSHGWSRVVIILVKALVVGLSITSE